MGLDRPDYSLATIVDSRRNDRFKSRTRVCAYAHRIEVHTGCV